jgi:hypothetical protein
MNLEYSLFTDLNRSQQEALSWPGATLVGEGSPAWGASVGVLTGCRQSNDKKSPGAFSVLASKALLLQSCASSIAFPGKPGQRSLLFFHVCCKPNLVMFARFGRRAPETLLALTAATYYPSA